MDMDDLQVQKKENSTGQSLDHSTSAASCYFPQYLIATACCFVNSFKVRRGVRQEAKRCPGIH
jgi:hypothetical protein